MNKFILNIVRALVGGLFIFSGLIKANDPLGLSYKMQEFFEVWHMEWLNPSTLLLSIVMIVFEILAGVALLLGWRMKLFSWLLLLLIIFFTFLTGYAYLSGKVRECGCFGDCIALTAGESFVKDLVLLILIIFIFANYKKIKPVLGNTANAAILMLVIVFSFAFQWYTLLHLPYVDCLPYKKGANIIKGLKPPPGAVPDSSVITFVYKKDGKQTEFTADKFPADFGDNYVFVRRYDKLIRKGNAEPAIKDFALINANGTDTTNAILEQPGYKLFLFAKEIPVTNPSWNNEFGVILGFAKIKNIPVYCITSNALQATAYVEKNNTANAITILACDATAIKTAARAYPVLYLIKGAVIADKWSYADFDKAIPSINSISAQQMPN